MAEASAAQSGPLARTTAMAEVPTGVARAAMVSVGRDMGLTESGGAAKGKNKQEAARKGGGDRVCARVQVVEQSRVSLVSSIP